MLKQVVDGCIVKVSHLVGTRFRTLSRNETRQLAWRGIGKDIAVSHMHASLVGLDNDSGNYQRRTSKFEEIVGGSHLVHLEDGGKDVTEGSLGVVCRSHIS